MKPEHESAELANNSVSEMTTPQAIETLRLISQLTPRKRDFKTEKDLEKLGPFTQASLNLCKNLVSHSMATGTIDFVIENITTATFRYDQYNNVSISLQYANPVLKSPTELPDVTPSLFAIHKNAPAFEISDPYSLVIHLKDDLSTGNVSINMHPHRRSSWKSVQYDPHGHRDENGPTATRLRVSSGDADYSLKEENQSLGYFFLAKGAVEGARILLNVYAAENALPQITAE